jgi:hypothetical protein
VRAVDDALAWLNAEVTPVDAIVVSHAFFGYLVVNERPVTVYPFYNVNQVDWNSFQSYRTIYSIYWSDGSSWYVGGQLPSSFRLAFSSGGVGVFEANPQTL